MAIAMPGEYAAMLLHLFCKGEFDTKNKGAKIITATENWTTKFKELFDQSKRLICRTPLCEKEIKAVDWMSMSAVRNSPGDYWFWGSATDRDDQGTSDFHLQVYQQTLFNSERNLMFNWAGQVNQNLPESEWQKVIQAAQNSYTLLPIAMYVGDFSSSTKFAEEEKRGNSNHIVVLLGTNGIGQQQDCLIWTWADIYRMQCSGFRKLVTRVYKLDFQDLVKNNDPHFLVDLDRIKELKSWMKQFPWPPLVGEVGREFT